MSVVYKFFEGRTATMVWFALVSATVLAACNRLSPAYAAVITAIPALQACRSVFEDFKS